MRKERKIGGSEQKALALSFNKIGDDKLNALALSFNKIGCASAIKIN